MVIEVPDWTRAIQLVGQDPSGDPVLVALDANGNIIAIMKGEYSGTLKTIAVDDQGRMIMIPTDPADVWGNAISMGNAELVARMTGLGGFDRRGNAIFCDGFESGLAGLYPNLLTTNSEVVVSSNRALSGAYSILLDLRSTSGGDVEVTKYLFPLVVQKIGFECAFTIGTDLDTVIATLDYYTPTKGIRGRIRLDVGTPGLDYLNSGGTYTNIRTLDPLNFSDYVFHQLKFVIDLENEEYVRVLFDGVEDDISGNATRSLAVSVNPALLATLYISCTAATNAYSYTDSWIITQNEPPNP